MGNIRDRVGGESPFPDYQRHPSVTSTRHHLTEGRTADGEIGLPTKEAIELSFTQTSQFLRFYDRLNLAQDYDILQPRSLVFHVTPCFC